MKNIPVKKNEEYIVNIEGSGYLGEGVAKINDYTLFVPGALKGEKAKIRVIKVNKNYGFSKLIEILKPSETRVNPPCKAYKSCGGCNLQHYSYNSQLEFKRDRVLDCLNKAEGSRAFKESLKKIIVHKTLGMKEPFRYRNKVQLPIGKTDNEVVIGFYKQGSHQIVNIDSCLIQNSISDKILKLTRQWIEKYNIDVYDEQAHRGLLRNLMIRTAYKTSEVMVVIVTSEEKLPHKEELIELLKESLPNIKSIIQNINRDKTNVILGKTSITLWGKDTIKEYIGDLLFNISPLSFFQVNPIQTEILYNKALEYADLKGEETVFDAYCGTGTISLFLSKKAKKVYGVEIIKEAIDNAKENAKENKINNAQFIVGKSEEVIPDLINKGIKAEVVVVDPPRKGCDRELLEALSKMKPEKIVYVSCDPATLARDLSILYNLGYMTKEIQPVDMFPMTGHVECVVLMSRVEK